MELWIKSQDGEFCGVVKEVYLKKIGFKAGNTEEKFLPPYFIACADFVLGKYETVERCKEIINKISLLLKNSFMMKVLTGNLKPEFAKQRNAEIEELRDRGVIFGDLEIVQIETQYYEMPQE